MKAKGIFVIISICILLGCKKIKYYPDENYHEVKTLILAHRGGGNSAYQENSLAAAEFGLSVVDGIEVDVQISKDKTIWLAHNADLQDCGGVSYDCFPECTDGQIVALDSCNGSTLNFSKLEDIFSFISNYCPDKYISIDVKGWVPCAITSSDIIGMMNVIAEEIIELTNEYNLSGRVMVESQTTTFLNYIKNNTTEDIGIYLTSFGDFERAMQLSLENDYSGISFKYKYGEEIGEEEIQMIRRKGLKIQLWTVNTDADILEALSINPDFIQTDNLDYFK